MAQKNLTFKQYKIADLIIFAVILAVLEFILTKLSFTLTNVNFSLTITYLFIAIVMVRWGYLSFVHCLIGGIIYCLASNEANLYQYIAFSVGNLFALVGLIYIKLIGKEKITNKFVHSIILLLIVYVAVCLGRTTILAILNGLNFFELLVATFASDLFSLVISIIVLLIVRRQDGVFEDQKSYLIRTEEERKLSLQNTNYEE